MKQAVFRFQKFHQRRLKQEEKSAAALNHYALFGNSSSLFMNFDRFSIERRGIHVVFFAKDQLHRSQRSMQIDMRNKKENVKNGTIDKLNGEILKIPNF